MKTIFEKIFSRIKERPRDVIYFFGRIFAFLLLCYIIYIPFVTPPHDPRWKFSSLIEIIIFLVVLGITFLMVRPIWKFVEGLEHKIKPYINRFENVFLRGFMWVLYLLVGFGTVIGSFFGILLVFSEIEIWLNR